SSRSCPRRSVCTSWSTCHCSRGCGSACGWPSACRSTSCTEYATAGCAVSGSTSGEAPHQEHHRAAVGRQRRHRRERVCEGGGLVEVDGYHGRGGGPGGALDR